MSVCFLSAMLTSATIMGIVLHGITGKPLRLHSPMHELKYNLLYQTFNADTLGNLLNYSGLGFATSRSRRLLRKHCGAHARRPTFHFIYLSLMPTAGRHPRPL